MMLDENERPMVPVYTCSNETEAEIVVSMLRENEISATVNASLPQSIYPMVTTEVSVLVSETYADRARALVESHQEDGSNALEDTVE